MFPAARCMCSIVPLNGHHGPDHAWWNGVTHKLILLPISADEDVTSYAAFGCDFRSRADGDAPSRRRVLDEGNRYIQRIGKR
jgi:hypothetical protein